jgi:DNA-binding transcriptional regulator LsrR (DeoR family)
MRPDQRTLRPVRDQQALQAAYLRARHGLSQDEIRLHLGNVSQSHVSRLLAHATDRGWLVTELRFNDADLSPDVLRELQQLLEPRGLVEGLRKLGLSTGGLTPEVRVFDSGSDSPTSGAFDLRARRIGRSAAGRLTELLYRSTKVGVTWGKTVGAVVDGLEHAGRSLRKDRPVLFVPVTAELVTLASPDYSSTLLADRLNNSIGHGGGERLLLGGVPAFIPRRYDPAKTQAIREYIHDAASYRRIFVGKDALIDQIDMIITSVGSAERPFGGALSEVLSAADVSAERLRSLIAGDVGGVLIPKSGLSPGDAALLSEINMMWTGITMDHLLRLAAKATQNATPGVVVIAIGRERAGVVREMISQQLINQLIIDWDLAKTLEPLIA